MSEHSRISPSMFKRLVACPGSLVLSEQCPKQDSSAFAEEGTKAHDIAASAIEGEGEIPEGFEALEDYVEDCRGTSAEADVYGVEERFDLPMLGEGIGGTVDFWAYRKKDKCLIIADLKYGVGVKVGAEDNYQLAAYAVAVAEKHKIKKARVCCHIYQPRYREGENNQVWDTDLDTCRAMVDEVKVAYAEALSDNPTMATGEQCRFCPAKSRCPKQAEQLFEVVEIGKEKLTALTDEDRARVLLLKKEVEAFLGAVTEDLTAEMMAGKKVHGLKLVAGRGSRSWESQEEAEALLPKLLGDAAWEKKLLTVAAAEKVVKANGQKVEDLPAINRTEGKPVVAPADDKRKEYQPQAQIIAEMNSDIL
jgi:hypothetical protein